MVGMSFSSVYAGIPWGTSEIADNAITSEKIKDRQIKSRDIKTNAIKTGKIRDGTIQGKDIDSTTAITVEQITLDGKITSSGYDFLTTQTRKLTLGANEFQPVVSDLLMRQ